VPLAIGLLAGTNHGSDVPAPVPTIIFTSGSDRPAPLKAARHLLVVLPSAYCVRSMLGQFRSLLRLAGSLAGGIVSGQSGNQQQRGAISLSPLTLISSNRANTSVTTFRGNLRSPHEVSLSCRSGDGRGTESSTTRTTTQGVLCMSRDCAIVVLLPVSSLSLSAYKVSG
jgi:hypothetical protein